MAEGGEGDAFPEEERAHGQNEGSGDEFLDSGRDDEGRRRTWGELFTVRIGRGIKEDIARRRPVYFSDWSDGLKPGIRLLAPITYIFLANAIPALAFGQQISEKTGQLLTVVQVLAATTIAGVIQSLFGGQPLLIYGVAEPIVIVYGYMYEFADENNVPFLPWATITLFYTGIFIIIISLLNFCDFIDRFTRFSGELFGLLIAGLFLQAAITGLVKEFDDVRKKIGSYEWSLVSGFWSMILAFGLFLSALLLKTARSWPFFFSPVRTICADYGPALMVVLWSGLSYIPVGLPQDVPRYVDAPGLFDSIANWGVLSRLGEVPGEHWATALVPAFIITVLFYFDHNVSSLCAQVLPGVKKGSAFHWDFFLLGVVTIINGALGLPPSNGALPQSPMHTRSLILKVRRQKKNKSTLLRFVKSMRSFIGGTKTTRTREGAVPQWDPEPEEAAVEIPSNCVELGDISEQEGNPPPHEFGAQKQQVQALEGSGSGSKSVEFDVCENRISNISQAVAVGVLMFLTYLIRLIPRAALSGYFLFMAADSLPGNQMWARTLLLFTDPKRRHGMKEGERSYLYLRTVQFKVIVCFTLIQLAFLGIVWGIIQIKLVGVIFPLFIMALVPFRERILPHLFRKTDLDELDKSDSIETVLVQDPPPQDPNFFLVPEDGGGGSGSGATESVVAEEEVEAPFGGVDVGGFGQVRHIASENTVREIINENQATNQQIRFGLFRRRGAENNTP